MCENIWQLLVTTQPLMVPVLWPHLLTYALHKDYNRAVAVVVRALAHLVVQVGDEDRAATMAGTMRFAVARLS